MPNLFRHEVEAAVPCRARGVSLTLTLDSVLGQMDEGVVQLAPSPPVAASEEMRAIPPASQMTVPNQHRKARATGSKKRSHVWDDLLFPV